MLLTFRGMSPAVAKVRRSDPPVALTLARSRNECHSPLAFAACPASHKQWEVDMD